MKLIENSLLEALSSRLSTSDGSSRVEVRIESYSCKMTESDKRLLRGISIAEDASVDALVPLSLPESNVESLSHSPSGYGCVMVSDGRRRNPSQSSDNGIATDSVSIKTLSFLIAALNASFKPDYDFSDSRSEEFSREPNLNYVISAIDEHLGGVISDIYAAVKSALWVAIDEEIVLAECQIFSYQPDFGSDPFAEAMWSQNFIFFNPKLKRLLLFTARVFSAAESMDSGNCEDEFLMD